MEKYILKMNSNKSLKIKSFLHRFSGTALLFCILFLMCGCDKKEETIEDISEQQSASTVVEDLTEEAVTEEFENSDEQDNKEVHPFVAFYNEEFSKEEVFPYFLDLDGDGETELIAISSKNRWTNEPGILHEGVSLEIYDDVEGEIVSIYADAACKEYYLTYLEDGSNNLLLAETPEKEREATIYKSIAFRDGAVSEKNITYDAFENLCSGAICLDESRKLTCANRRIPRILTSLEEFDYSSDMVKKLVEEADVRNERIIDATLVNSEGKISLYATLGAVIPQVERDWGLVDAYVTVLNVDDKLELTDLGDIYLVEPGDEWGDYDWTIQPGGKLIFGDICHYSIDSYTVGDGKQYKYGEVNEQKKLIDSDMEFVVDEGNVFCEDYRTCPKSGHEVRELVEVTFQDGEYRQYCAVDVSETDLIGRFANYMSVKEECVEILKKLENIGLNEYEGTTVTVDNITFESAKMGNNGKLYLTFSFEAYDVYFDETYMKEAYFTLREENGELVREKRINEIGRLETSGLSLPLAQ